MADATAPEDVPEEHLDSPQEDHDEPEPATASVATGEGAPKRANGALIVAVALAVVFGLTTIVLAVVIAGLRDDDVDDHSDVELAAGQFAQAFVDRDADLASLRDDVLPLVVDPFAEEFQDGVDEVFALSESLGHQQTRATIQEVYTTATSGDAAHAIVVYDALATFADGRTVSNENQHLRLGLIRTDDGWKVNQVVDLLAVLAEAASPDASGGAAATTTTTGAPSG